MELTNFGRHNRRSTEKSSRMRVLTRFLTSFLAYFVIASCIKSSALAEIEPMPVESDVDFHDLKNDDSEGLNSAKPAVVADVTFMHAFIASFSVIIVSELGDKTFFIAAIMAMKHPRITVFSGAIFALGLMTVLSALFGTLAQLIPRVYTYYISTALFAFFGLKMLKEGYYMKDSDAQEELEEVQSDLKKREDQLYKIESGKNDAAPKETVIVDKDEIEQKDKNVTANGGTVTSSSSNGSLPIAHRATSKRQAIANHNESSASNKKSEDIEMQNIDAVGNCSSKTENERLEMEQRTELLNDPETGNTVRAKPSATTIMIRVFMQAMTMTFLAEWGDRSQLATIILSARENVYGVIVGGVIGHAICTGIAVIGGRMIAQRISVRTVTIVGGVVFLLFAISALFFDPNDESPPDNL
ncbi:putative divalent cation/proton antiporter TMEM165 isoform X1 [Culicoides brevitarsis]|uniref:putative divalent cation/proton antiporter TMEM165 isoform X1 n=1 Tax=Culicoides brevitarsis TaxID=469753 RepID=UPI00307C43BA